MTRRIAGLSFPAIHTIRTARSASSYFIYRKTTPGNFGYARTTANPNPFASRRHWRINVKRSSESVGRRTLAAGSLDGSNSAARACGERISCLIIAGCPLALTVVNAVIRLIAVFQCLNIWATLANIPANLHQPLVARVWEDSAMSPSGKRALEFT